MWGGDYGGLDGRGWGVYYEWYVGGGGGSGEGDDGELEGEGMGE